MKRATIAFGAILLLGGCGHAVQQMAAGPAATVDPEIRSLRAQLAHVQAERNAALARLHALERRTPAAVRVVVRAPAGPVPHPSAYHQPATDVFTTLSTAASP